MKNPKPKSITRRTREPSIARRDPSNRANPTDPSSSRLAFDARVCLATDRSSNEGLIPPQRNRSHRFNRRVDPRARRSSVGRRTRSERCGMDIHPTIHPSLDLEYCTSSFRGVPPETTNCDSTNRDVGHPVSIQTDRSIGRADAPCGTTRRTRRRDERDGTK